MGCTLSKTQDERATEQVRLQLALGEVYVFVPGLRLPKRLDFGRFLTHRCSTNVINRLTALRSKVVTAAEETCKSKPNRSPGESNIYELQSALVNYLAALLGMTTEGSNSLSSSVEFVWINQEDESKETALASVYYELLSVFHLLAILSLLEANTTLTPKPNPDGHHPRRNEEKNSALDMLLKAAQVLDYAVKNISPKIPSELKDKLPADIRDGALDSLQMQALGQGVEIQLGLASNDLKATLAVKRRLACECALYWKLAYEKLQQLQLGNGWGEKHVLYLKWKRAASRAAAYYYHGLVMNEGRGTDSQAKAAACFQASEASLVESQEFCRIFCSTAPATKKPPLWGVMKSLSEKIPKEALNCKTRLNKDLNRTSQKTPQLPEFTLSLQWDEFELPSVDSVWTQEKLQ